MLIFGLQFSNTQHTTFLHVYTSYTHVYTSVKKRLEFGCRKPYLAISHIKRQKPDEATFRHKPSHNHQTNKKKIDFKLKRAFFCRN